MLAETIFRCGTPPPLVAVDATVIPNWSGTSARPLAGGHYLHRLRIRSRSSRNSGSRMAFSAHVAAASARRSLSSADASKRLFRTSRLAVPRLSAYSSALIVLARVIRAARPALISA